LAQVVSDGLVRPFEAILEVSVAGGVPLHTQLVAVRICEPSAGFIAEQIA
jgi:hypothetical protein